MVRPARAVRLIAGTLIDDHLEWAAGAHELRTGFCPVDGALLIAMFDDDGDLVAMFTMPVERWSTLDGAA